MLDNLKRKTVIALALFGAAKFFGLLSIPALVVGRDHTWVPILTGSLWGGCLIASGVVAYLAFLDQKEDRERAEYLRLKKKYDTALVVHR